MSSNNHRELTLLERLGLLIAPMSVKYRILERIYKEGHARGLGKGEAPGLFGIWNITEVDLDWKDEDRKSIHINRQPIWESIVIAAYFYFMAKVTWRIFSWI